MEDDIMGLLNQVSRDTSRSYDEFVDIWNYYKDRWREDLKDILGEYNVTKRLDY